MGRHAADVPLHRSGLSQTVSAWLPQAVVAEFIARGNFEPNLARVRSELQARRDAMLSALGANAPGGVSWSHPAGGYFVWLELDGADAIALAADAEREGVAFVPGPGFFAAGSGGGSASARFAYSYETPDRITEGVERVMRLLG